MIEPYYNKDGITIYNADCLDVMGEMKDSSVSIIFTSPPYNRKRNDKYKFFDDTRSDYFDFLTKFIDEGIRITNNNMFINLMKNYYNKRDVLKLIGKYNREIYEIFIWEKYNPIPAPSFAVTNAYEFVLYFGNNLKSNEAYTKNHLTTSINKNLVETHKAIMNEYVSLFFIKNFTKDNDIILDPFLGSGTTLLSAMKSGRKAIGIEISKEYCDIAVKRLEIERSQYKIPF